MRSKTLLISNILATLYAGGLLWFLGDAIANVGGFAYLDALISYFDFAFRYLGDLGAELTLFYVVFILCGVHILLFALGSLIGWIAFAAKKSGGAKFAATLYLLGTLCFPVCLPAGLPITIVGFVGGSKQKKRNNSQTDNSVVTA